MKKVLGFAWVALALGGCDGTTDVGGTGGNAGSASGGSASGGSASGGSGSGGDASSACASISEEACGTTTGCSLYEAYPIDAEAHCASSEYQVKGCGAVGCTLVPTAASDPDGVAWLFMDGCFPPGWTPLDSDEPFEPCNGGAGGGKGP